MLHPMGGYYLELVLLVPSGLELSQFVYNILGSSGS